MTQNTLTDPEFRVVVVTGCDTGFGAEIVEDLYQLGGYTIYANCLTAKAVKNYQAKDSTRLRPIQLDVTNQEDVNRHRARIDGYAARRTNIGGHFDMTTVDVFERVMNVNYMGIIRITKGLLPSLRAYAKSRHILPKGQDLPRARLITMTSVAGRISLTGLGSYSASKHASESLMDTLRVELSPWEIDVSIIEPFFAQTPIVTNSLVAAGQNWKRVGEEVRRMYGSQFMDGAKERNKQLYENDATPSAWVVQITVNAIHKKKGAQKPRILVGFWYVRFLVWFIGYAPSWIVDGWMRMG
ncbi:Retinol dehydrogenase 5 [Mortierella sp. AD031]|nr:Retinol dehydrogenase 5 [Mortierella sp. AD031]